MSIIWEKFNSMLATFSGFLLVITMVVGCVEVVARYVFNSPIVGVVDLITVLIPIFVFLPLADTEIKERHIRVELLSSLLRSPRWNAAFDLLTYTCGFIFLGLMSWVLWKFAIHSWNASEYLPGLRRIPVWPSKFALVIGAGLFTIQLFLNLIKTVSKLLSR